MEAISTTYLRSNMASSFARADRGEKVLIRRNNHLYALVSADNEAKNNVELNLREAIREVKSHMEGHIDLPDAHDIIF